MNRANIPLGDLEEGPIRHAELPPMLVARIKDLHTALAEVYPSSLTDWLDDFRRDTHPEQEVAWWERLARCYRTYKNAHPLDTDQRQAVFRVLVNVSMGTSPALLSADLAILPKRSSRDLQVLIQKYEL